MATEIQLPNLPRTEKTLLEILKVHNKEVPMANLLAYLFNPEETHHLGTLFIDSLLETTCYNLDKTNLVQQQLYKNGYKLTSEAEALKVNQEINEQYNLPIALGSKIKVEKSESRKRIDLFISNEQQKFAIIIEFKLNHVLNNPLEVYRKSVENKKYQDYQLFFVVLTPNKKDVLGKNFTEQFRQVILSDLVKTIKSKLSYADVIELNRINPYFQYFLQFMNTVENRRKNQEIRDLILKYNFSLETMKRGTELERSWYRELERVKNEIELRLKRLKRKLKMEQTLLRHGTNSDRSIIPFNQYLKIETTEFSLKVRLTLKGWAIEKWEKESENGFRVLEEYAYTSSTDFLAQETYRCIKEISFLTASSN